MATAETQTVHPGDIIQDSEGLLYLVAETHRWGVGAVQRWRQDGDVVEHYYRLRASQHPFVVVGAAARLPEEVAQRRRDSIATSRALAKEQAREADEVRGTEPPTKEN